MTPTELRTIRDKFNPGGTTKLARILDITPRTMRKKLSGESPIKKAEAELLLAEAKKLKRAAK